MMVRQKQQVTQQWVSMTQACNLWGFSPVQLKEQIDSGSLILGVHYQDRRKTVKRSDGSMGLSQKGLYYFNVQACNELWSTPLSKRA